MIRVKNLLIFHFNSSDYKFTGSNIDEGAFENVFLVKNINLYVVGDQEYASKIINAQSDCSSKEQVNLIRETEIHGLVKFTGIDFHHSSSIQFSLNTSPNNEEQSIKAPSSIFFFTDEGIVSVINDVHPLKA